MITALQNFISKKGKFVFVLLLALVIVSFVLYLSQGSSVFDLLESQAERKEFFGYDWNNPEDRRMLDLTNRAGGSLGSVVTPIESSLEDANNAYLLDMQNRLQAALRSNPEEVDQSALQRMFGYMQAWPGFPSKFKAREIARSNSYSPAFIQSVVEAKVALDSQASSWGLMPTEINNPRLNEHFTDYLGSLDPSLILEQNRSRILSLVGSRYGMSAQDMEAVLYSSFRVEQVDETYSCVGFSLPSEVRVLPHEDGFAWDGEAASLRREDLPETNLKMGEVFISSIPKDTDSITFRYGSFDKSITFTKRLNDANASAGRVHLGESIEAFADNLKNVFAEIAPDLLVSFDRNNTLVLETFPSDLPAKHPKFETNSTSLAIKDWIIDRLKIFHEENRDLDAFSESPRTIATALIFRKADFYAEPAPAPEARLRSFFERNRSDFEKKDGNLTTETTFEEAKDEVARRILEQDRKDAQSDSELQARDRALEVLDGLNRLTDQLTVSTKDLSKVRESAQLKEYLDGSGAELRRISFSPEEMALQARILGLEARTSERRTGKEPLQEVSDLDSRLFFTRSIRKCKDGYVVFVLDAKSEAKPANFESLSYASICEEYLAAESAKDFTERSAAFLEDLRSKRNNPRSIGKRFRFLAKNPFWFRQSLDGRQRTLQSKIGDLEKQISAADSNKTGNAVVASLQSKLSGYRLDLQNLREERLAVSPLLEKAKAQPVDGEWFELEKSSDLITFGKLDKAYLIRGNSADAQTSEDYEASLSDRRSGLARSDLISDLIRMQPAKR